MKKIILTLSLVSALPLSAFAWGGRGHDHICQAAIHLVKNSELKEYLNSRGPMMGHLCNVPDIHWRSLEHAKSGNPAHYFEPEVIGKSFADVNPDYKKVYEQSQKSGNVKTGKPFYNWHQEIGSNWWRTDQFSRLAVIAGKAAKEALKKASKDEKFGDTHAYNKNIFEMTTMMGLMGHFIGDASQPYHNTVNYDGWDNGHGGIHSYYEEAVVSALSANLIGDIVSQAEKQASAFSKTSNIFQNMKILSERAYKDLEKVEAADQVLSPSIQLDKKGLIQKTPAKRSAPGSVTKKFDSLIISEMSLAASLIALTWDQIYEASGKPSLQEYRSFRYPFLPDFVAPDYLPEGVK